VGAKVWVVPPSTESVFIRKQACSNQHTHSEVTVVLRNLNIGPSLMCVCHRRIFECPNAFVCHLGDGLSRFSLGAGVRQLEVPISPAPYA
jgi:hypothetical protein